MILGSVGRITPHEVSLEVDISVGLRATIGLRIGPMDMEIVDFKIFMAPKIRGNYRNNPTLDQAKKQENLKCARIASLGALQNY